MSYTNCIQASMRRYDVRLLKVLLELLVSKKSEEKFL